MAGQPEQNPEGCDLTAPFEHHGEWWLPHAVDRQRVPGTLTYTPEHGLQLQLHGSLKDSLAENIFSLRKTSDEHAIWGLLWAFAGRRVQISLLRPIPTNRPNDPSQERRSPHPIYYINNAIVGVHVTEVDQVRVSEIQLSIEGLESFVAEQVVRGHSGENESYGFIYSPMTPIRYRLEDQGLTVEFSSMDRFQSQAIDCSFEFSYRVVATLEADLPRSFVDLQAEGTHLVNLLALCSEKDVVYRRLQAVTEAGEIIAWYGRRHAKGTRRDPLPWLLTLKEIGQQEFGHALEKWFNLRGELGFMADVFFSEVSVPSSFVEARFFHFAGCLEALHRNTVGKKQGRYLQKDEFKAHVEKIESCVDESLPERLRDAISMGVRNANNHAFAERLDDLFRMLAPECQKLIAEEPVRFLAAVKNSRNKLAHVDEGRSKEVFEGSEYAYVNAPLQVWIRALLLKMCGISETAFALKLGYSHLLPWGPFRFAQRRLERS